MIKILNALKLTIISILEAIILFIFGYVIAYLFSYVSDWATDSELWYGQFYQNIYTLLAVIIMFILFGIIMFTIFKFIEIKLISEHKKDSYQYLLIPCVLIIIWEIAYSFSGIAGVEGFVYILLWSPMALVIVTLNQLYEFKFINKKEVL
jgi:hypothetical protein